MNPEIATYKELFDKTLEPIKVMLLYRKDTLAHKEWMGFVERTKSSIMRNPDQYLGAELPEQESLNIIVTKIFDDFLGNLN